jgi:hypothetical protein
MMTILYIIIVISIYRFVVFYQHCAKLRKVREAVNKRLAQVK